MLRAALFAAAVSLLLLTAIFMSPVKDMALSPGTKAETAPAEKTGPAASYSNQISSPAPSADGDIQPQSKLAEPPAVVRGLYLTSYVAGVPSRVSSTIELIKRNSLNAVVIDIKDYSGAVSYRTGNPEIAAAGAERERRIRYPNRLIKTFHDNNIYVIGRVTVFQDPIFTAAHPEFSLKDKITGRPWRDRRGLSWVDPAARPAWDYVAAVAESGFDRGFDEINFDYVRFPSDGRLENAVYPYWDKTIPRSAVMAEFFSYLRRRFSDKRISADLFGLTTIKSDDMGIGQILEDAYRNFDYVSPMVYPSHFAAGFEGYKNPADHPYEIVKFSMEAALIRLNKTAGSELAAAYSSPTPSAPAAARLRPWLQVFDLGTLYDSAMVKKQIAAVEEILAPFPARYAGYLLWDPKNLYDKLQ